jgi:transcriptional regulator with GAF, ATPase, and Fis domain
MVNQQRLVSAFIELADTLVDTFDVMEFLDALVDLSVELLDVDAAGLMLVDQQGRLQQMAASRQDSELLDLFELQTQEGPCLDCYETGAPVVNVGAAEGAVRWPTFFPAVLNAGYTSVHAIPLRLREQVIGAINLFVRSERDLTEDDLALGRGLADMATIGLLQERAVHQQQILAEQLQGALTSRVRVEQAKGMVAERQNIEVAVAFNIIRSHARRQGRPLAEVAAEIIDGTIDTGTLRRPDQAS